MLKVQQVEYVCPDRQRRVVAIGQIPQKVVDQVDAIEAGARQDPPILLALCPKSFNRDRHDWFLTRRADTTIPRRRAPARDGDLPGPSNIDGSRER
jgi:hypothetical protein